jgi:hypothetical protein
LGHIKIADKPVIISIDCRWAVCIEPLPADKLRFRREPLDSCPLQCYLPFVVVREVIQELKPFTKAQCVHNHATAGVKVCDRVVTHCILELVIQFRLLPFEVLFKQAHPILGTGEVPVVEGVRCRPDSSQTFESPVQNRLAVNQFG